MISFPQSIEAGTVPPLPMRHVSCVQSPLPCREPPLRLRGFDPEGAERAELVEATLQLLEYEQATGIDLRSVMYDPSGLYDAEGDQGAWEALSEEGTGKEEEEEGPTTGLSEVETPDDGGQQGGNDGATGSTSDEPRVVAGGPAGVDGGGVPGDDATCGDDRCEIPMEPGTGNQEEEQAGYRSFTLWAYAKDLGVEMLVTVRDDLNALVGLLPAPMAKPIRQAAAAACGTAKRVVVPVASQAERYTRGLRREAARSAGKLAVHLRDEVCPRVARGLAGALGKAKRSLVETVRRVATKGGDGGEEEVEDEQGAGELKGGQY